MIRQYKVGASLQDAEFDAGSIALGINVLRQDGTWPVRELNNVDISPEGVVRRRRGYELIHKTSTPAHSIYTEFGKFFYVSNDELKCDHKAIAEVSGKCYYTRHHDWLSVSHDRGVIFVDHDGAPHHDTRDFEISSYPTVSVIDGDGGRPGSYQVAIALIDDNEVESGAKYAGDVTLEDGQAIVVSGLPEKPGWHIAVYITEPDNTVLRHAITYSAFQPRQAINSTSLGKICETIDLLPMLGGDHITSHNSRIFTAKKDILSYSSPFRPHLYHPVENRILFSGKIRMVMSLGSVIWVADNRGIWKLTGVDSNEFNQSFESSAIVVDHSAVYMDTRVVCVSNRGYIWMDEQSVHEFHSDRIALRQDLDGRSAFLTTQGVPQVISLVRANKLYPENIALDFE